jgi:hypothetical protein
MSTEQHSILKKQLAILIIQIALFAGCAVNEACAQVRPASPADSESMKRLIANTQMLGGLQRKFDELGGAKVGTLKSKEDVDNRISVLDELIWATNEQTRLTRESGGNDQDALVLGNLHGMQLQTREQLMFFKNNYGKWKVSESGEAEYSVPKEEMDKFTESLREYNAIRIKQLELLQARAEARKKLQKKSSD